MCLSLFSADAILWTPSMCRLTSDMVVSPMQFVLSYAEKLSYFMKGFHCKATLASQLWYQGSGIDLRWQVCSLNAKGGLSEKPLAAYLLWIGNDNISSHLLRITVHSFNNYLLSTKHLPNTVLGTRISGTDKTDEITILMGFTFHFEVVDDEGDLENWVERNTCYWSQCDLNLNFDSSVFSSWTKKTWNFSLFTK